MDPVEPENDNSIAGGTVVIADDHPLVAQALHDILIDDLKLQIIAQVTDGLQAVAAAAQHKPDLITLDVSMPFCGGLDALTEIRRQSPATKVVVYTGLAGHAVRTAAMSAGAAGFFLKSGDTGQLREDLIAILNGETMDAQHQVDEAAAPGITPREQDVLNLIGMGLMTSEIAAKLGISDKTVGHHRASLLSKLDARNSSQLIVTAMRQGYLTDI